MTAPTAPLPRAPFITALAMTALWALAVAGIDASDVAARVVESLRNVAWLWFLYALVRDRAESRMIAATYTVVGLVSAAAALLAIAEAAMGGAIAAAVFTVPRTLLQLMAAVASLVLVHRVYVAVAPGARGGIRLALGALAAMWGLDLFLFSSIYVLREVPSWMVATRGLAMVSLVPLLAVSVHRDGDWSLQLSRTFAFRSLSLAGIGAYALVMTLGAGAFAATGGSYARLFQTAFIAGTGATLLAIVATPWLRAWLRVKVAKHLFRHRYDYRHEWLRFTATLGQSDSAAMPLDARIAKAMANLTDSPGALLLVPEGDGLGIGAAWNWDAATGAIAPAFARLLAADARIVELDTVRRGAGDGPQWLIDQPDAWAVVPLIHAGKLAGAVVLSRPPVARALDWEDFDLLRVTASQAASYREQARADAALAEAQRFDEFNRRFAFIMHDVKNLVSQLTLVARNAERHADNPDFRADMVATLQESCGRMNELLARLSQHHGGRADPVRPTEVLPIAESVAQRRRRQHPVVVTGNPA
ncbi:MAG TPA: XrtA/PEP-CTERM system histidine kinase PrsK, partial [Sphingomonas sp.]|nr:XrtA/PEP-CTERM system histidine kinase PrsK [Sphingomonas sp.]